MWVPAPERARQTGELTANSSSTHMFGSGQKVSREDCTTPPEPLPSYCPRLQPTTLSQLKHPQPGLEALPPSPCWLPLLASPPACAGTRISLDLDFLELLNSDLFLRKSVCHHLFQGWLQPDYEMKENQVVCFSLLRALFLDPESQGSDREQLSPPSFPACLPGFPDQLTRHDLPLALGHTTCPLQGNSVISWIPM